MARTNVRIVTDFTGRAPTLEEFETKLKTLPKNVMVDVTQIVDVDALREALDKKKRTSNRNLTSYQNDIYY